MRCIKFPRNRVIRLSICLGFFILLFGSSISVLARPFREIPVEPIEPKPVITTHAQPIVNYLGMDPTLPAGVPSPPGEEVAIFGKVVDPYGKIMHAVLSYSTSPGKEETSLYGAMWNNVTMTLINGVPSNGTYWGIIPKQFGNTTIFYKAYFKDDLNYTDTEGGRSYYVGDHKLLDVHEFPVPKRAMIITARLADYDSDVKNVTLHYTIRNLTMFGEEARLGATGVTPTDVIPKNFTTVAMTPLFSQECLDCAQSSAIQTYKAKIPAFQGNTIVRVWLYVDSSDRNGNSDSSGLIQHDFVYDLGRIEGLNSLDIRTLISNVDVNNRIVKAEIEGGSKSINSSLFDKGTASELGSSANFAQQSKTSARAVDIFVHGFNLANNIVQSGESGPFSGSFELTLRGAEDENTGLSSLFIGNDTSYFETRSFSLIGDSSAFPFDHYYLNLIMRFPAKNLKFDFGGSYDKAVLASWIPSNITSSYNVNQAIKQYGSSTICNIMKFAPGCQTLLISDPSGPDKSSHSTILSVHIDFERNYTIAAITLPLLAIFYLLGTVFVFKNSNIGSRLALTLGIFALIFTLPQIINSMKPVTFGPTVADSLLSIIIFATISFTIGSVISSNVAVQRRFPRHYAWTDTLVFILVSSVVIALLRNYDIELTAWLIPVILTGLGYGLLLRISKVSLICKRNPERLRGNSFSIPW